MVYEVEKRARLVNQEAFDALHAYLENHAEFCGKKEMKSYLFQKPSFLRIRLVAGEGKAIITEKFGEYSQAGRVENEHEIDFDELRLFINTKENEGYSECSLVHTLRYSYLLDGLKVELNDIEYLGLIVEIEALTEDQSQIPLYEAHINKLISSLGLQDLDPNEYQAMMTQMYAQSLKPTTEHSFAI